MLDMQRREFITLVGSAAAWPLAATAQQPATPVVGLLIARSPDPSELAALRQGLAESGYEEGHNVAIEQRWVDRGLDRLPALAADLVKDRVDVIIAGGSPLRPQLQQFRLSSWPLTIQ